MGMTIRLNIRALVYILVIAMVLLMLDLLFMMSLGRHKATIVKSSRNHDQLCAGTKPEVDSGPGHTRGNIGGGVKIGGTVAVPINRPLDHSGSGATKPAAKQHQTWAQAARKPKLSPIVQKAVDMSTALASPNVTCIPERSRNRMLNVYGEKFNLSIPPFLNMDFEREPHILDLPFPFGVQDSTKLVKETLGIAWNTSLPFISKSKSCLRCVIVGNGGLIKDTSLGKVIDNFDVVLRINDAPTKGYEKDVGSKTTMRMCYPESAFTKPEQFHGNWLLLLMVFKPMDLTWLQTVAQGKKMTNQKGFWKKIASSVPKKPEDFRILNPSILRETGFDIIGFPVSADGKVGKNVPTSGCLGIMLALRFCDEVAIAGFGYDTSIPNAPLHYYDKLKMKEIKRSWTHSVDKEQKMLFDLVDQGVIQDLTGGLIRT
ncbi:CMP-N-acetylneuraminate-beta-1,4-galactoside alpha-2,3-sialyltransferase-like isoform X3 [Acanthaster planci]|uniref:Lactosylceramide alpha-2,3-sialyltransferase n=1 Tax=Acanthaster planci TaxID=133434 RepID=A0A8B7YXS2_ACAPL|nr:CMP-N-acetylneuraminate-beta-1,4-galactoside alpha-2,3-sialyltransferase-like isoform X3 [Acanthaster planci]